MFNSEDSPPRLGESSLKKVVMKKSLSKRKTQAGSGREDQLGLERLVFFSDAVFAIAITLLALNIRLPSVVVITTDAQLASLLAGLWHNYLAYFLSFMVIGAFWISHHRRFRFIQKYDGRLILINLLMLMTIGFIPFTSSVISTYSGRSATIFYTIPLLSASLLLTVMWGYASWHNRLTAPDLDTNQRKRQFIAPLIMSIIFLLSIGIAYLNADIARLSLLLILPLSLYANLNQ